jgi:hypothetical protein
MQDRGGQRGRQPPRLVRTLRDPPDDAGFGGHLGPRGPGRTGAPGAHGGIRRAPPQASGVLSRTGADGRGTRAARGGVPRGRPSAARRRGVANETCPAPSRPQPSGSAGGFGLPRPHPTRRARRRFGATRSVNSFQAPKSRRSGNETIGRRAAPRPLGNSCTDQDRRLRERTRRAAWLEARCSHRATRLHRSAAPHSRPGGSQDDALFSCAYLGFGIDGQSHFKAAHETSPEISEPCVSGAELRE